MKKFLIIIGSLISLIVLAIILLPIIFKDDIQRAVDDAMSDNLNASVYYDTDNFSLSLIKNFPDFTLSIGDFGIVGIEAFEKDTLVAIKSFDVTVDIMSALTDQIKVKEIVLNRPQILVKVLDDGTANYDIAKESEEAEAVSGQEEEASDINSQNEESALSIAIDRWAIVDGELEYIDATMDLYTALVGLNHEGKGDFTLDVFDLTTKTQVESASFGFEGVTYAANKSIEIDLTLNMNLPEMAFAFKDNRIAINDFAIEAEGILSMPGEDINMDIRFGGKDITLKSILSLIPGVYQEYLAGVTASGEINFDGFVKGTYNENTMPAVGANLSVFDGAVRYAEYNIPIEAINIETNFSYPSADLSQTSFNVEAFSMLVDGERVEAYLKFRNLEDYQWDFGFDGNADLEKITKIIPLEGMTLRGKLNAGLKSSGKMSDIEAERYESLPTSGSLSIDDFYFQSGDLPQGFSISRANLTFDPEQIALNEFAAKSGLSDFALAGSVNNYLAYVLKEGELLTGSMNLSSNLLDLNEFMSEKATEEESVTEDTTSMEVVRVPENIDFTFASSIKKITFTNLDLNDFEGKVVIRDGAILLEDNTFKMLDGTFSMSGSYVTKDLDQPKYDLGFKIQDLSIGSAFEAFSTVQEYVPIAERVAGKFSTDFKVNGLLGADMMPLMEEVNLAGLVNVAQATLSGGDFMNKLNAITALKSGASASNTEKNITLKDVLIKTEIRDGRLFVEPFDLTVKGQTATLGGSNTLDGKLDYSMQLRDIPTGAIGNALNNALSSLTGGQKLVSDKINLNLGIGGTYDDVSVKLLGTSPSGSGGQTSPKAAFKQQLTSKVDEEKAKAEAELEKRKEEQRKKLISEAEQKAAQLRSQGKASAEKIRKEGYAAADKLIKDAGSNPIKKRVAQEAAKKLRAEADKKADAVESEANQKADQLVAEAKAKAAKI
ncbi:MAG: AsmA-like C-terminal region-containing protein [Ekhidna sp.]